MTSRLTQATENGATVLRFEGALDLPPVSSLWEATMHAGAAGGTARTS